MPLVAICLETNHKDKKTANLPPNASLKDLIKIFKNKFKKKITAISTDKNYEYTSDIILSEVKFLIGYQEAPTYDTPTTNNCQTNIIANKSYVSNLAIDQITRTANSLPDALYAFGMPDLHPGQGCPIGCVFITQSKIYPPLIGSDVGCGMLFSQTNIKAKDTKPSKLEKRFQDIEFGNLPLDVIKLASQKHDFYEEPVYNTHLGTIGLGNHFCELQQVEEVLDRDLFDKHNLSEDYCYLLAHSGSRKYGYNLLQKYSGLKDLDEEVYLKEHNNAVKWAIANRELITETFLSHCSKPGYKKITDITHNFVEKNDNKWVHRKGVIPTDHNELLVIPGSRGALSYLVTATDKGRQLTACGASVSHGAGRSMSRADAYKMNSNKQKSKTDGDISSVVICPDKKLIYEEEANAYKDISGIMDDLLEFGLIKIIASFRPLLTIKK